MLKKIINFFWNNLSFLRIGIVFILFIFVFFTYRSCKISLEQEKRNQLLQKRVEEVLKELEGVKKVYNNILLKERDLERKFDEKLLEIELKYDEEYKRTVENFYKSVELLSGDRERLGVIMRDIGFREIM